jgi:hypothetical protein
MDAPINRGYLTAYPHNLFLHVGAEMGLCGLGALGWLLLSLGGTLRRALRDPAIPAWISLGLLGVLLANCVTNLFAFDNATTQAFVWGAMGLLAGLTAREHVLVPRLSSPTQRGLRSVALLGGGAACGLIGMQLLACYYQARMSDAMAALPTSPSPQTWHRSQRIVMQAERAVNLAPYEPFLYTCVFLAYQTQMAHAPDMYHFQHAQAEKLRWGERGLRVLDRESFLLRLLFADYLASADLPAAERIGQLLLRYEPNSAEVHLQYTDLLEYQRANARGERHARQAACLDPTNPLAWMTLAHFQYAQLVLADLYLPTHAEVVCTNYRRAARLNPRALTSLHRMEYTLALVLAQRLPDAIREGRHLRGTPEFTRLLARLRAIAATRDAPAIATLIHALEAPVSEGARPVTGR